MNQLCKLVCEYLLTLVELASLPAGHSLDLLDGEEGQHANALHYVRVGYVSPVLEELERRGLFRVEPYCALLGLAHLLALGVEEQRDSHSVSVLAELLADKLGAAQHICPLVVAAELHVAAVLLVQHVEVVALHDHVVKLEEGQTALPALLVALEGQHLVYAEACAYLAQNVDVVEVHQPVGVVYHDSLAV